jgi:hypothetical protein
MNPSTLASALTLTLAALLSGCSTLIAGPQQADDGAYVVSVTRPRTLPTVIDTVDEAVAEARYKCWSAKQELSVLSAELELHAGPLRLDRRATVKFVCLGGATAS